MIRCTHLVVTFAVFLGVAPAAYACSCSNGGARTALRGSAAVFLGRVVSISPPQPSDPAWTAQLVVVDPMKNVQESDTVAVVFDNDTSCRPWFTIGGAYLVYARRDHEGGRLYTGHCEGTKPLSCALDDYAELGRTPPNGARSCAPPIPRPYPRESRNKATVGSPNVRWSGRVLPVGWAATPPTVIPARAAQLGR